MLVVASTFVASCSSQSPGPSTIPTERDSEGTNHGAENRGDEAQVVEQEEELALARPDCSDGLPTGTCETQPGLQCGDHLCVCTVPCSGAAVPPDAVLTWQCSAYNPECSSLPQEPGKSCEPEGLVCNNAQCGGTVMTCKNGTWDMQIVAPPP